MKIKSRPASQAANGHRRTKQRRTVIDDATLYEPGLFRHYRHLDLTDARESTTYHRNHLMRIPLILTLAVLAVGNTVPAADATPSAPSSQTALSSRAANDPRNVLSRVDARQETNRAPSDRRFAEEARWFQGRLAVYRATAEVAWLNRIDKWLEHSTDPLLTVADPVAALRAAQVAIGFHTGQRDTLTTAVPAS